MFMIVDKILINREAMDVTHGHGSERWNFVGFPRKLQDVGYFGLTSVNRRTEDMGERSTSP
jgi:hypothetical protein